MKRLSLIILLLVAPSLLAEDLIIRCTRPCTSAKAAVRKAGGSVTQSYKYIDAIAATVPDERISQMSKSLPAGSVRKDLPVELPAVSTDRNGVPNAADASVDAEAVQVLDSETLSATLSDAPQGWEINNTFLNVQSLHSAGKTGAGVKVAVIDSGIRPGFLNTSGAVIGGENFVPDALGFRNTANNPHGTFVAGMIGNRFLFNFTTHPWLAAVQAHCPTCVRPGNVVAMFGSAPASSIYALRVFPPSGGAPESRIIAAMERVIQLRENYDNGIPETFDAAGKAAALNIRVCNMSLGGSTFHAGRDLEDQLTNAFLERDIVLVVSAGNNGPSGSTGGSPGTGYGALTVGAASTATHERILRHIQFGAVNGAAYRPSSATQTAYFSSRGPTADGSYSPDVTANGFASFSSNGASSLNIGSGTSYSAPTVSGVAAVLRGAHPTATARQIHNAIVLSANAGYLGDGSTANDQGYGFVNAAGASALLAGGSVPDTAPAPGGSNRNVNVNIVQGTGIEPQSDTVTQTATLLPGQRHEIFYKVLPNTAAVVVTLSGVTPGATQNLLFGDDVIMSVHTAKTSAIGASGDYPVFSFSNGGTWTIAKPDTGLMRVTMTGDWTNASPIGATVNVTSITASVPGNTAQGKVVEGDSISVPFTVPAGAAQLTAHLEWAGDWGAYPTNDLDLVLVPPAGPINQSGATINSPERATINSPVAGNWTAYVLGFSVADDDRYKLVIAVDGTPVN